MKNENENSEHFVSLNEMSFWNACVRIHLGVLFCSCEMRMHVNFICTLIEWSPLLKRKFTPIMSFALWFSSTLALRALQWRWSSQLKMLAFVQNKCRYLYFFYVSGTRTRTQTLEPGRVCIYNYIHTYKLSTLLSLNLLLNRAKQK